VRRDGSINNTLPARVGDRTGDRKSLSDFLHLRYERLETDEMRVNKMSKKINFSLACVNRNETRRLEANQKTDNSGRYHAPYVSKDNNGNKITFHQYPLILFRSHFARYGDLRLFNWR
ncbi:hypothetical protein WA026_007256, partial [Henosepilachna vigintioctopunctata]